MSDLEVYLTAETPNWVILFSFLLMSLFFALMIVLKRDNLWPRNMFVIILLAEYIFLILCETVIFRSELGCGRVVHLSLFWNYRDLLNGTSATASAWEVLLNIVLFVPIGLFLSMLHRMQKYWKVILFSVLLSSSIEISQYVLMRGVFETDDILHNLIGAIAGYMLYMHAKHKFI